MNIVNIMGGMASSTTSPCRVGDCLPSISSSCYKGNCSKLNLNISFPGMMADTCTMLNESTCKLATLQGRWTGQLSYDEEGCFSNNDLRNTPAYDRYMQVTMISLTILLGSDQVLLQH